MYLHLKSCVAANIKMFMCNLARVLKSEVPSRVNRRALSLTRHYSQTLENKYSDVDRERILKVINETEDEALSCYDITKARLKKFSSWKHSNGKLKHVADLETIDGFTQKTAVKLCDSILKDRTETAKKKRIKGQVLDPPLSEDVKKSCRTVLSVFVAVNSVSWTLIDRNSYEVIDWQYYGIEQQDKKFKLTDILELSWKITYKLPPADVYVMKAEATTLRAAGSDPNNPKVISVNLQRAQMVAVMVALLNARSNGDRLVTDGDNNSQSDSEFQHRVYFLRPTLPYRLYGTLVGNEKVSTDQTVEMIVQSVQNPRTNESKVHMSEDLISMFRSQKDLQKDMLGHCLLLGLTFMDVCVYNNQDSINKLLKRGE